MYQHTIVSKKLSDTADKARLSRISSPHNLVITIEKMIPEEYENDGERLTIHYNLYRGLFGNYLIAATDKGVCNFIFYDNDNNSVITELRSHWPNAQMKHKETTYHKLAQQFFNHKNFAPEQFLKLHLKGTHFQLKVWQALLRIHEGKLVSYRNIANAIAKPTAQRAVGSAIGKNPVAYLIPCHRVIKNGGVIGNYRWGVARKLAMIGWEMSKIDK